MAGNEKSRQPGTERRFRPRALVALGGAGLLGAGVLIGILTSSGSGPSNLAVGVISCTHNNPVEGAWITDSSDPTDSGRAKLTPPGGVSGVAIYSRPINGQVYEINAGCGRSPKSWAASDYSTAPLVTNIPAGLQCDGVPGPDAYPSRASIVGVCQSIGFSALVQHAA